MQYVRGITGGGFSVDLTAAATALDRSKAYEVIVWQQHTMPNANTIYARSTVTVTDAQWNALLPSPGRRSPPPSREPRPRTGSR